jgi:hypothetical protein
MLNSEGLAARLASLEQLSRSPHDTTIIRCINQYAGLLRDVHDEGFVSNTVLLRLADLFVSGNTATRAHVLAALVDARVRHDCADLVLARVCSVLAEPGGLALRM